MACGSNPLTSIPRIAARVASTSSNRPINPATRSSDRFRPALAASLFRSSRLDSLVGSGIRLLHRRIVGNGGIIGTASGIPPIRIHRGYFGRFREPLPWTTSAKGSSGLAGPRLRAACQTGRFPSATRVDLPFPDPPMMYILRLEIITR